MASQKRKPDEAYVWQLLELDLSVEDIWFLKENPYEATTHPRIVDAKEVRLANRLHALGLLEKEVLPDGGIRVRCTDLGTDVARTLTIADAKRIRHVIETRIGNGELTWSERAVSAFLYRVGADIIADAFDPPSRMPAVLEEALRCRDSLRDAQRVADRAATRDASVLRKHRGRIVNALLEDSSIGAVREKHHPDTLLKDDLGEIVPFYVDTDDEDDEP